ncbi:pyruvate,water dikinase [Altererythrobacter atlanticus]|uniref:Phosphoenolpyruvate synthase n=1 Tax=Croceibacterium atlanticum TaxID=1267766 RepID=A0A0F7KYA3_9SPHN|nr:PEP/pyruvate-binding domain-containing protein [Croceibacterium atlanticum]AKH44226.1 Phosphoenolpyruvate synthase [Croceibacterium atlanticum]MBB5732537.1 pyruvate,water dikinase [Croceibacterium atlanticum]
MSSANEAVAWFRDVGIADRPTVGGKGGSLGELTQAGIPVPPGFVVTTHGFELFLQALEARDPVRSRVEALDRHDLAAVTSLSEELRARVLEEKMPAEVEQAIVDAYRTLCPDGEPVAVRSSATTEDAEDASFAGLQDTFLWVLTEQDMVHRVRECWGSLYSTESMTYRLKHDFPESGVAMGVVVQRMVDARCAGVMFTRSPTTGDKSVITVEGAWGLGSAVVSGEVTPDKWVIGKITGEISDREISDKHARQVPADGGGIREVENKPDKRKAPCLTDEELMGLREVGRRIERHYGKPQDIEWAVDQDGQILLLQSRPETVWATKDKETPVKKPEGNALNHVMTIFGGKK